MKRKLTEMHRLPDWFKRRNKYQKRRIGEQKYRTSTKHSINPRFGDR